MSKSKWCNSKFQGQVLENFRYKVGLVNYLYFNIYP